MLDDITTRALTAAIRGGSARQQAIAQNIANADTPGYKAVTVEFEGALAAAIAADRARLTSNRTSNGTGDQWWDRWDVVRGTRLTDGDAVDRVGASSARPDLTERVDGSSLDADQQMADLAANQIAYNTNNALLRSRISQFRLVISGQ